MTYNVFGGTLNPVNPPPFSVKLEDATGVMWPGFKDN